MDRTKATITQHYYWPNLRDEICTHVKVWKTCQKNNNQKKKCDHLPANEEEVTPCDRLPINIIGPYKIRI